jgi:hypothetical protein
LALLAEMILLQAAIAASGALASSLQIAVLSCAPAGGAAKAASARQIELTIGKRGMGPLAQRCGRL